MMCGTLPPLAPLAIIPRRSSNSTMLNNTCGYVKRNQPGCSRELVYSHRHSLLLLKTTKSTEKYIYVALHTMPSAQLKKKMEA